ncbi:hypothetical protein F5888DRAFT_603224 [Russula emetica]|nr:hypothetical protein F5888DRAFT_603224 [Russula emetica]
MHFSIFRNRQSSLFFSIVVLAQNSLCDTHHGTYKKREANDIPSNSSQAENDPSNSQITYLLTHLWIHSSPSSLLLPSPSPRRRRCPPSPSIPIVPLLPMAAQPPLASLLRGHSSSTGASYPSSAHHSSLSSLISFFSCLLVRSHQRI